jgi:hypothetical protein
MSPLDKAVYDLVISLPYNAVDLHGVRQINVDSHTLGRKIEALVTSVIIKFPEPARPVDPDGKQWIAGDRSWEDVSRGHCLQNTGTLCRPGCIGGCKCPCSACRAAVAKEAL